MVQADSPIMEYREGYYYRTAISWFVSHMLTYGSLMHCTVSRLLLSIDTYVIPKGRLSGEATEGERVNTPEEVPANVDKLDKPRRVSNGSSCGKCFLYQWGNHILITRWLPGFVRVPYNAPSPCHMHPIIIAITLIMLSICQTIHSEASHIYVHLFFICNTNVSRAS